MKRKRKNARLRRLSPYFADAVDRAMEKDQLYFFEHPGEASYVRDLIPGEFGPKIKPHGRHVLVTEICPGVRTRNIVVPNGPVQKMIPN